MSRRDRHDSGHGEDGTPGSGPAPADLLQMWISGLGAAPAASGDSNDEQEDQSGDRAGDEPGDQATAQQAAPEGGAPAEQPAESSPERQREDPSDQGADDGAGDAAADGTARSDATEPEQTAPEQAAPEQAAPEQTAPGPAGSAGSGEHTPDEADETGPEPDHLDPVTDQAHWHDEVEHEWTFDLGDADDQSGVQGAAADATSAEPEPSPRVQPGSPESAPAEAAEPDQHDQPETVDSDEPAQADQVEAEAAPPTGQPSYQPTGEPDRRAGSWASFGTAHTAEDVLAQAGSGRPWHDEGTLPLAEAASAELGVADEPADESTPPDPEDTAQWSVADFEDYLRERDAEAEQSTAPGGEPAVEAPSAAEPVSEPDAGSAPPAEPKHGVRGLLSRMGLTRASDEPHPEPAASDSPASEPVADRDPAEQTPDAVADDADAVAAQEHQAEVVSLWPAGDEDWAEPDDGAVSYQDRWGAGDWAQDDRAGDDPDSADAAWPEPDRPVDQAGDEQPSDEDAATDSDAQPALFGGPEPDAEAVTHQAVAATDGPAGAPTDEPADDPAGAPTDEPAEDPADDPDRTAYFDFVIDDAAPAAAEQQPEPAGASSAASASSEATPATEPSGERQEWFDDQGLRWTSDDGGYTWFADDGQGWNAEIGEPIENPYLTPAPAPAPEPEPAAAEADEPSAEPEPSPAAAPGAWPEPEHSAEPEPDAEAEAEELWPTRTGPVDLASLRRSTAAAEPAPSGTAGVPEDDGPEIPQYVEYKPRGAYRPLLGVLFVAAAIFAVVAIFWAVSKGSQAATGIAAGVTGFALAFWWGLLSWTPTVVSLHGSSLEVTRGSEGERFDLTSPKLDIDVDDDTGSRNWRTTITRPNGTELVIPASAVDPDEFTAIVQHYRAHLRDS